MKLLLLLILLPAVLCAQANRKTTSPPMVGTTSTTGPHQGIINWSDPGCTSTAQCSLQVYRASCASASTCPTYSPGAGNWSTLNMSTGLVPNIGVNGTTWNYTDKDTALQDSTTYAWVATCTYVGASTASGASTNYTGTTNGGTPPAPTTATTGNSVN